MAPISLKNVRSVLVFEFRRHMSGWRGISAAIVAVALLAVGIFAASRMDVSYGLVPFEAADAFLRLAPIVIAVCAAVMFSECISEEFDRGTGFMTLSKPVSRHSFFAGKYLGGFLASAAILALYLVVAYCTVLLSMGSVPAHLLWAVPLSLLYLFAASGVCILMSSAVPRNSIALVLSMLLVVLPAVLMAFVSIGFDPWASLGYSSRLVYDYPEYQMTFFSAGTGMALHTGDFRPEPMLGCAVIAAYGVISVLVADLIFGRRHI